MNQIQRAFPSDELREPARATNLIQRERKLDIVALFYTLSLGFAAGSDRSIQVFLERYVEMGDCDELTYATFHGWFEPAFVALLREILEDAIKNLDRDVYRAPDIAQLYWARWEIELLFKELKSRFGLDEIKTTDPYIIEALIIMATISLLLSRVIVDELQKLDAEQRERADEAAASSPRLSRRHCSHAVERHAHLSNCT